MPSIIDSSQRILITIFHYLTAFAFANPQVEKKITDMKHIVIVGGQYAGVGTAHRFLKQGVKRGTAPYKVTLVSRDSHFYWNLATSRGVIPGKISDDEIFQPIAEGFSHYGEKFEFVLGSALEFDTKSQTLKVAKEDGGERVVPYDILILATGARTKDEGTPFKSSGSTESTKRSLHNYQSRIEKADSIAIIGAGTTGVETAGELAGAFGSKKKIILLASGPNVLSAFPSKNQRKVESTLRSMNVDVRANAKVQETEETAEGQTELTLKGGEKILVDFAIPTYGVIPNSSFVEAKFLNEHGYINVDEHLRLRDLENVYAIGEVSAFESAQFVNVENQSKYMAKTLQQIVAGTNPAPYRKALLRIQAVSISNQHAVGHAFDYVFPSFIFRIIRYKLFIDWLPGRVNGAGY